MRCLLSSSTHNSDPSTANSTTSHAATTSTSNRKSKIQVYSLCTNWVVNGRDNITYYKQHCSPTASHVHPVKLNSPEKVRFIADFMDLEADND